MARRKETNVVDVLFDVSAMLPWWAGVLLAIVSYLVCHAFATSEVAAAKTAAEFAPVIQQTIIKTLASLGQFILPMIFLAGAAASGYRQVKRGQGTMKKDASSGSSGSHQPGEGSKDPWSTVPDQHDADNYPTRHSDPGEIVPPIPVDTTRWSAALLNALEWKRFEMVCAGLFERLGFAARTTTMGADGGVDIHLYRPPAEQPVAIVQCKAWKSKVGVNIARELHGVMTSMAVAEGILATTSTFSREAKTYGTQNGMDLMDGNAVLRSINTLTDAQQASLLQIATAGDYTTPTCPSCGVKLTKRSAKPDGKPFWGCVNYPRCKSIINMAKA